MGPNVRAAMGNKDRHVAKQFDIPTRRVAMQIRPLLVESELGKGSQFRIRLEKLSTQLMETAS